MQVRTLVVCFVSQGAVLIPACLNAPLTNINEGTFYSCMANGLKLLELPDLTGVSDRVPVQIKPMGVIKLQPVAPTAGGSAFVGGFGRAYGTAASPRALSALLYLAAGLVGTLLKFVRRGRTPQTKTMPSGWGV